MTPAGQGVIPNSLWLIRLLALALALGHRVIRPAEAHAPLILEGLERLALLYRAFSMLEFRSAYPKELIAVILQCQKGKETYPRACTRPVSEAGVNSPSPPFLPSLSYQPKIKLNSGLYQGK